MRWMLVNGLATSVAEAEAVGDYLIDHGVFCHVKRSHMFENAALFYRFAEDWPKSTTSSKSLLTNAATTSLRKLRKVF